MAEAMKDAKTSADSMIATGCLQMTRFFSDFGMKRSFGNNNAAALFIPQILHEIKLSKQHHHASRFAKHNPEAEQSTMNLLYLH